jgi:hypothetical protein
MEFVKKRKHGFERIFDKNGSDLPYDENASEPLATPLLKIAKNIYSENNKTLFFFIVYENKIYILNLVDANTVLFNISCFYKTICKIMKVESVNIIGSFDFQVMKILKYGFHIDEFPINRILDGAEKEKVESYIGNKIPKYELLTFNNETIIPGTTFKFNGNVKFTVVKPNQGILFENNTHSTPNGKIGILRNHSARSYSKIKLPEQRQIYRYMACLLDETFDTDDLNYYTAYDISADAYGYDYGDSGIIRGNLNFKQATKSVGGKTRKKRKTKRRN